ncbi:MAG: nucleoside triphosphate pyrophosphatase [Puniceicoccaceae bacterium]
MAEQVKWILASGSPRRRELLARIQPVFKVIKPDVDEWEPDEADPIHQTEENAARKGRAVSRNQPDALVIAADTTVCLGGRIFGKPADLEAAFHMLKSLSGREHTVVTGMALFYKGREKIFNDVSRVLFRELDDEAIREYTDRVHVLDKAGAYGIQEQGELIIDHYDGSFENIMGLPIQRLRQVLVELDWVDMPDLNKTECQKT